MNIDSIIHKVISGKASPEEKKVLDDWVNINESNREEFLDIKLLLENIPDEMEGDEDSEMGLRQLKNKITAQRTKESQRRLINLIVKPAVFALFLLGIALFVLAQKYCVPNTEKYNNTPLKTIFHGMERNYGLHIEVSSEITSQTLTGTFYHVSPQQLLLILSQQLNLNLEQSGKNTYQLTRKTCLKKATTL